jgi:hypothetical protein
MARIVSDYPRRIPNHRGTRRNVARHHSPGPNDGAVTDRDRTEHDRVGANMYVVADVQPLWTRKRHISAQKDVVLNLHATTDSHTWMNHDTQCMVMKPGVAGDLCLGCQNGAEYEGCQVCQEPGRTTPSRAMKTVR